MKYCKHILAVVAFLSVFMGTFSTVIIESAYLVQKQYIAKVVCENRNNTQMHCNGKCYLKKQLKQDEQRNKQTNNFEKFEMIWLCNSAATIDFAQVIDPNNFVVHSSSFDTPGFLRPIDHPPA